LENASYGRCFPMSLLVIPAYAGMTSKRAWRPLFQIYLHDLLPIFGRKMRGISASRAIFSAV
jgi:hypothetical protein